MAPRSGASAPGTLRGLSAGSIQILIFKRFFVQLSRSLSVVIEFKYRHNLGRIGQKKYTRVGNTPSYAPNRLEFSLGIPICPNNCSGPFYCCHRQTGNGAVKHKKTSKTDFDIERPERPQSAPGSRGPPQGGPWGPYQPLRHPQESTRSTNHILLLCHRQTGCCLVWGSCS
jgi:hypothetical protein